MGTSPDVPRPGLRAGVTCSVQLTVLTVSRHPAFAGKRWLPLFLSFRWPSIVYALDVLAWDVFFSLSMLFAAPALRGSPLATWIQWLMVVSAALALAGLSGVVFGDMQLRNIGIAGYVGVSLIVAVLLAVLVHRALPSAGQGGDRDRALCLLTGSCERGALPGRGSDRGGEASTWRAILT